MYGLIGISTRIAGSVFKQNDITEVQIKKTLIPATICERENVNLIDARRRLPCLLRLRADRQVFSFPFECSNRFLMKLHNFLFSRTFFASRTQHSNVDKQQDNQMIYGRLLIATHNARFRSFNSSFPQFDNFREACRVSSSPQLRRCQMIRKFIYFWRWWGININGIN